MPILDRKSFNSERNSLTVNSLFLECTIIFRDIACDEASCLTQIRNLLA